MNYAFIALLTVTIGIVGTIVTVFVYSITMPQEKELPSKNPKTRPCAESDLFNQDALIANKERLIRMMDDHESILKRNTERDAKRYKIDRMRAKIIPGIKTGKVIAGSKTFNWDTIEKKEVSKPFKFSRRAYSNTFNAGVYAMFLR
jgi:hypothetical protein